MHFFRTWILLAGALVLPSACSSGSDMSWDSGGASGSGATGSGGTGYTAPVCDQQCQDYLVGLALADTVWLLYNQNIAGTTAGAVDLTAPCPLGGTAHITGTTSVSTDGITSVHLSYDLSGCANSASFYSAKFSGLVQQNGTFDGEAFTSVTFSATDLTVLADLNMLDDPTVDESCGMSVTQESNANSESLDGQVCGRLFSSVTALDGLGDGSGGSSRSSGGSSGSSGGSSGGTGSGGIATGGPGCPSIYDGTYIGQFAYDYETNGSPPTQGTGSFNLTIALACIAVSGDSVMLAVTHANASHPYFGCEVGGCTPSDGSVAVLPAQPPTTPSNPSQSGQGVVVVFPNGVVLGTDNQPGALNVTSGGAILSNSVTTSTYTWSAASTTAVSAFPGDGSTILSFKSWSLSKSNLP